MFISTNTQQINRNGKERTLHSFVCPALLYSFLKQAINRHQIYEPRMARFGVLHKGQAGWLDTHLGTTVVKIFRPGNYFTCLIIFTLKYNQKKKFFFLSKILFYPQADTTAINKDNICNIGQDCCPTNQGIFFFFFLTVTPRPDLII